VFEYLKDFLETLFGVQFKNSLGQENWPFSTAKAGIEENRTNHVEKSTNENQNKENLALL